MMTVLADAVRAEIKILEERYPKPFLEKSLHGDALLWQRLSAALRHVAPPAADTISVAIGTVTPQVDEQFAGIIRPETASAAHKHVHYHIPDGYVLSAEGDNVRIEPWNPPEVTQSPGVEVLFPEKSRDDFIPLHR